MGKVFQLLCILAVLTASAALNSTSKSSPSVKLVSGAYLRPINGVLLFEKFLPLTFYSTLPKMASYFASVPECRGKPFICRLLKEMTVLFTQGQISLLDNSPYVWKSTNEHLTKQRRSFLGLATTGDLEDLHYDQLNLERYLDKVVAGTASDHQTLMEVAKQIHSYSVDLRAQLFHASRNLSEIITEIQTSSIDDETVLAALIQNLGIMSFQMDMVQTMGTAAAECRSGYFSRSLVPEDKLLKKLSKVKAELLAHGWEIVGTPSQLMKQKFGDCAFGTSMAVQTFKLPIKRRYSEFAIHEIIKIPFQFKNSTCTINEDRKFVITDKQRIASLVYSVGDNCDIGEGYCKVQQNSFDENHFSDCARTLLAGGGDLIEEAKKCILRCHFNDNQLIVTELGNGETALTNAKQIVFTCNGSTSVSEFPGDVGAVILRIPCSCKLLVNKEHTVRPEFPCMQANSIGNVSFTVHLPSQWLKINASNISDVDQNLESVIPAIDPEWPFRIPTINITPPVLGDVERVRLSQRMSNFEGTSFLVYVWLTVLSLAVVVLVLKFIGDIGVQYLRASMGVGMIRPAAAVTPGDVGNYFAGKISEIELGAAVIVIMWIIIGIIAFCIGFKLLRAVNRISSAIDYFTKDEEEMEAARFRRSNSRRR